MTTTVPKSAAAIVGERADTVAAMFVDRVRATGSREAYRFPVGDDAWESRTWTEVGAQVDRVAAGLIALGVQPGERVAIASGTRYEWIVADLAIMCAGAATTTVYPSTIAEDVGFILSDSDSRVVFVEDAVQLDKLRSQKDNLPGVTSVVLLDGSLDDSVDDDVLSLPELEAKGAALLLERSDAVAERVTALTGDDLATLIYTSGTTGRPKGVRLSHSSWTYEGAAVEALDMLSIDDLQYLWLPLAHSFGKVLLTLQLAIGMPTAVDGRVEKIVQNLAVVRPTWMGAAPRIFEKAYGRVVTMAHAEGGAKAKIFDWAGRVGVKVSRLQRDGQPVPRRLAAQYAVADRLVFSKVRARFGGRVRFFISGSAALSPRVAEWFHAAGILILEGYGLTETSAGSMVNRPDRFRIGTVGIPFEGTEVKVADDGELLLRGPGVMQGYHRLEKETSEVLVGDGWLATGDIGEVDDDGFVTITDRKKDLFKTSGGKYVAPSNIEGQFKAVCPLASQIVVHGNGRNYVTAVITLDPDAVAEWASRHGQEGSYAQVVGSEAMRQEVDACVDKLNARLNRWEQIKSFVLLEHDLSIESGELTPSMKVKRRVVEDNYRDRLDALYD
jgi:long-chain acyl-CoA synthetase